MIRQADVISYLDMCKEEGVNLQRGMNYRLRGGLSVILMSLRPGAPYADRVEADGRILIYEGHDVPQFRGGPDPKLVDQPYKNPGGTLTQNGLFYQAVENYKKGMNPPDLVRVYEKIRPGIWVYNGLFGLIDAWVEQDLRSHRKVFKYKLELVNDVSERTPDSMDSELEHTRVIPTAVKLEVWRRDKGRCVTCGSQDNLHFDHIIPYSLGGSSLIASNIQILCARHNLRKRDRIE